MSSMSSRLLCLLVSYVPFHTCAYAYISPARSRRVEGHSGKALVQSTALCTLSGKAHVKYTGDLLQELSA